MTQCKFRGTWLLLLIAGFAILSSNLAAAARKNPGPKECRLIINWDQMNMWALQLTYAHRAKAPEAGSVKAMIEAIVDEHAKAKVDRIVHCVFALPRGAVSPGFRSFARESATFGQRPYDTETGIRELEAAGHDFLQILIERSHKDGMEFLAGLRMNDRHGQSAGAAYFKQHPEWRLEEFSGAMDYKHPEVRQAVLAFAEEFLNRYDVDGIELDWMRHCHVFKSSEAVASAPILTAFVADMRKVVDRARQKRGRGRLLLGVRVPQTVEECRSLGFDVRAWAQQGLVDYLCPSDFFHTDFNLKTEDFVRLTKGTQCKVYPSVHPMIARGIDYTVHDETSYRAAAKNYYAYGADGISAYNYQYHWRKDLGSEADWPRALGFLTGLRSPAEVARGERRYLFYPMWPAGAPTGARKYDLIRLARGGAAVEGFLQLRVAEDLKSPRVAATLEFKVPGMVDGDALDVTLNGQKIPANRITRIHDADGQTADEGRVLPAFYLYRVALAAPPLRFGDNELRLSLSQSAGQQNLEAQEFEIRVRDNEEDSARKGK